MCRSNAAGLQHIEKLDYSLKTNNQCSTNFVNLDVVVEYGCTSNKDLIHLSNETENLILSQSMVMCIEPFQKQILSHPVKMICCNNVCYCLQSGGQMKTYFKTAFSLFFKLLGKPEGSCQRSVLTPYSYLKERRYVSK